MMILGLACCLEKAFGSKFFAQGSVISHVSFLGDFITERLGALIARRRRVVESLQLLRHVLDDEFGCSFLS